MRLRKVKDAFSKLSENSDIVILEPKNYKAKWQSLFNNDNEIRLEIGCGKGQFIVGMAKAFPNINFIAMEKFDSVLLRAMERLLQEEPLPNLKLVLGDAQLLNEYFIKGEISNIYLNFSDPWPKAKHAKRRLTSPIFLGLYKDILPGDGKIIQKTDNHDLFYYSLEMYEENGFSIDKISYDLHKEDWFNIRTEFEDKWSKLGPIYFAKVSIKHE